MRVSLDLYRLRTDLPKFGSRLQVWGKKTIHSFIYTRWVTCDSTRWLAKECKEVVLFVLRQPRQSSANPMCSRLPALCSRYLLDRFILLFVFPNPAVVFQKRRLPLAFFDCLAGPGALGWKHKTKRTLLWNQSDIFICIFLCWLNIDSIEHEEAH